MSNAAMDFAWRHCPYGVADRGHSIRLVHLACADSANDLYDHELWFTQARLGEKAGVSRQATNAALARLVADGFLELLEDNSRANKPNRYRFLFPQVPVIYDTRQVSRETTPSAVARDTATESDAGLGVAGDDTSDGEVSREATPGVAGDDSQVSREATQNPKRTQEEPNLLGDASPSPAKRRRKPERPLPDDWTPADTHRARAALVGAIDVDTEAEAFRAHAGANDRRARDWNAAFTQWLINAAKYDRNRRRGPTQTPSWAGERGGRVTEL